MTPHTHDARRETQRERRTFATARRAEVQYARQLRGVAQAVGHIAKSFRGEEPGEAAQLEQMLRRYSDVIRPWATVTAKRMLHDVMRRDEAVWAQISKDMTRALRNEVRTAPTGALMQQLLAEQVHYITSIPLDAAQRVQQIAQGTLYSGARPDEVAQQIMRTGEVSRSKAVLIARTEVARVASNLTQARALHVGSEGYIWRTANDADVRPLHRKLHGKFIRWDEPPVAGESGERAHAGQIYNCRCYPEPVIPEEQEMAA